MKITLYPKYFLRSLSAKGKEDFFSAGYRFLYPECSRQGMTPWQHYVMDGKRKGYGDGNHPPADVFFAEGYEAEYPDVTGSGMDPWRHYAEKGQAEGRDNGLHPDDSLFFADGYLAMYPDVAEAGIDPWHHYVMSGRKEGRDNGFNPDWTQFFAEGYLAMYPDVAEAGIDPWHHYVLSGRKEGRSSGLHPGVHAFSAVDYLAMYPDVAESGQEPWHHYVLCGKEEGRYPTAIAMKRGKSRFMPYSCALLTPDIGAEFSDSLGRFDLHTLVEILKLKSGKKGGSGAARGADSYRSQKLFRLFGNDDAKKIVYFCSDESLAEKQCRDEVVQQFIDRQYVVLAISWDSSSSGFILHCHYGQNSGRFDSADLSLLLRLGLTNTAKIFLGSLDLCPGNADELDSAADLIISLKKQTKAMLVYSGQVFPGNSGSGQDSQTASDSGNERNRTVYAKLLNSCDGYMFVSGEAFSNAAKICSLDPEKIIQDCLPAAKAPVGQWAYSRDRAFARFTVLVCGTAEGERGYEYVKDLAGRLAETHPDVRIVVLGESQESEAPENVNVTGAYDSSRMPELMRIFEPNCAVVPFVSAETLSAVQEMTAFGVPVVTFDTGSSILSAYRQKVQVPNISADGLHKAVSELYDLSYPYKLKKHARRYSVSSEELRFINQHEGRTGRKGVRTTLSICINVADENEDYESILDYLNSLPAAADAPASPKRGRRLLESDDISICFLVNEKFIDEFRQSEKIRLFRDGRYKIIPTNGCGAFKLLREPESYGKVIYIGAFSKFVSSIEKYYILTSLFGKSGEQIGEISSLLNRQDVLLYLDNFYKTTSRNVAAKRHQNEAYLQARRAYLTHGSFEQYLDHSDSGICAFRNAFAFNISLLKKVSGLILDKRFFVSCPDQVVFDLALNDLTVRAAYKYIELIPGSVAERHLSSQRELFHEMALANFNLDFYLEKYSEMKDRNVRDPFAHFRDHGFDENRLYADFISDEWLESHYDSADDAEKYYLKSYQSYAEARFIYGMSLADYKKYVGLPGHYLADPAEYFKATVDFSRIKLSFIVPVYNSAKFLRHCLDSIYKVDYPDFEVILVDDGSKDNSVEIINEYKEKFSSKTKVIIHPENMCFAATHKDGINAAEGKYFTIIDADDYISEDYAKVFVKFAEVYHLDMAVCDWTRPKTFRDFYSKNDYLIEPVVAKAGELQDSFCIGGGNDLIPNIHVGLNRKIYNRESFVKANPITIDQNLAFFEDVSATLNLSTHLDWTIGLIKNRLYAWFDNEVSLTNCDITEKLIVHFVYALFVDLKDFVLNKEYCDRFIIYFWRNLYHKLEIISNLNLLKKRLEFLASQYDQHIDLVNSFPFKLKNYIKGAFNRLYFRVLNAYRHRENKVCVIDSLGHYELKDYLLPKLRQERIDFYYTSRDPVASFADLMVKLDEVNKCSIVVTDGDWLDADIITDLPIINTWHGMGALKYCYQFIPKLQPVIGFSSGKDTNFCYRWIYNLPDTRIITNGNLVASMYLHADFREKCRNQFFAKYPELKGKRIYLYTPTFRGYEPKYYTMEPGYDWASVSALMHDDEVMLVKWHPCLKSFNSDALPDFSKYSNIIDVTDSDLSEVLMAASVLLTDYSSCIFYAALIDLPVGILSTDLDSYSSNRGFFIDYRREAPCEVFEDTDSAKLLEYIRSRRSDTREYQEFKHRHVGGVTDNVDEIITSLVKNYMNGSMKLFG